MTGTEMLIAAVVKAMGLDPDETKKSIANVGQFVAGLDQRLTRIEAGINALLLQAELSRTDAAQPLGIPDFLKRGDHAEGQHTRSEQSDTQ